LRLLEKEKGHLVTGFVGTPYFCHALSENGHTKEAYDLLLKEDFPSWLYQVKMGATTIWEHWDGIKEDGSMWSPDMNSFNHYAYGAIGEWLYRVAAGIEIDQEQPGYKHGILYPHPDQRLQSVSASYETVYGKLGIMWKLENKMFQIEAEIPVNTTATIVLEKEWEVVESKGLVFKEDDGVQKAWCGSGKYWVVGKAK
ncbi:MAG: alpha-L-rhamnosidase C-terminal domain-containing protein, partial [Lachnospiraceae bacterium]